MGKRVQKKKVNLGEEALWQKRYLALQGKIQCLYEEGVQFDPQDEDVPEECYSASDEFFISNDMHVVDNEEYALKHWGKGRYFRVVVAPMPQERNKDG